MENKNNTGAIFKNDKKAKETHPDYRGKIIANGKEMEIALWMKTSAKGVRYFSVSLNEPYVPVEEQQAIPERTPTGDSIDDDLPF